MDWLGQLILGGIVIFFLVKIENGYKEFLRILDLQNQNLIHIREQLEKISFQFSNFRQIDFFQLRENIKNKEIL